MIQLVGEYVAQYARDFIAQYCTPTEEKTVYDNSSAYPSWEDGSIGQGKFHCCCSAGVWYMYNLALGIDLYALDFNGLCSTAISQMPSSPNWIDVTNETLQPGDVLLSSGHTEMYLGGTENANFGNSPYAGKISPGPRLGSDFTKAFRLQSSVDVTPNGALPSGSGSGGGTSVNFSDFYFNGIPDGKYSLAHTSLWTLIVETLAQIADYLIGILTYIIRIPFIGWTAIMDNLLNWTVNTVTDTEVTEEDMGIDSVEVEGADDENRLTIDGLLYNDYQLTNINIFE